MASKDTDATFDGAEQSSKPRRRSKPRPARQSVSNGAQSRSNSRRELVEKEIMEQATRLFAERGFASTTLQDIAAATGLTRPALYHYVANKDELLSRLVSEITEAPAVLLHEINERTDLSPLEKLHAMATALALHQTKSPDRFLLLVRSEAELSDDIAAKYRQNRRQVLKELIRLIEAGIRGGEIRTVDPRTAALGIIGMLNWIAWWHRPGGPREDEAIATELAKMAVQSLAQQDGASKAPEGPAQAIGMLRQNLDHLERLLESPYDGTDSVPGT